MKAEYRVSEAAAGVQEDAERRPPERVHSPPGTYSGATRPFNIQFTWMCEVLHSCQTAGKKLPRGFL